MTFSASASSSDNLPALKSVNHLSEINPSLMASEGIVHKQL